MKRALTVPIALGLMGVSFQASAQEAVVNMAKASYQEPGNLVIAIGLVAGFALVINGILHFKNSALNKMQYPASEGYARVFAGAMMLGFTFVYTVIKNSFFTAGDDSWNNGGSPIALDKTIMQANTYGENSFISAYMTDEMKAMVLGILWLIGLIFLFVGIFKLKDAMSNKDGSIKAPILNILGGVFCMNPMIGLCMIAYLGPKFLCSE